MREVRIDAETLSFQAGMGLLAAISVFFLLVPTIIVLLTSLTSSYSLKFPPDGLSLRWYEALLDARQMQQAALTSFKLAIIVTIVSMLLGTAGALAIGRSGALWAKALDGLFLSPLLLPALAFGFATLMYFSLIGVRLSLATLAAGHVVVCVPFVLRTTIASLTQLDPALLESSISLGAGAVYTLRRVSLPLIGRGVAAGGFLGFMASFDNIPGSLFLSDARTEMLPIHLWQTDLDVHAAAAAGVLIIFALVVMVVAERFAGLSKLLR